jgi:hypothetical protein
MNRYVFFILLTVIVIIIQTRNYTALNKRITALETSIQGQIIVLEESVHGQTKLLLEAGQAAGEFVAAAVIDEVTAGTAATGSRITRTNERIQQIDAVYAGILAELEKRTLDSLYTETGLKEKEMEAGILFREGKYPSAGALYAVVAEAQPENVEARFYFLYSLFLSNKLDRSNYQRIKDGLQALDRNGYHRAEIREVLEHIELEERGLESEASN